MRELFKPLKKTGLGAMLGLLLGLFARPAGSERGQPLRNEFLAFQPQQ